MLEATPARGSPGSRYLTRQAQWYKPASLRKAEGVNLVNCHSDRAARCWSAKPVRRVRLPRGARGHPSPGCALRGVAHSHLRLSSNGQDARLLSAQCEFESRRAYHAYRCEQLNKHLPDAKGHGSFLHGYEKTGTDLVHGESSRQAVP